MRDIWMASSASSETKLLYTLLVIDELLEKDDDVDLQLGEDLFTLVCDPDSNPTRGTTSDNLTP